MERKLMPKPPKILVVVLGIVSFISLLAVLFGHYGHFVIAEAGNVLHEVKVSFNEENKFHANSLFEELKSEGLNPELIATTSYNTEQKGFMVALTYEGKDRELLADKTNVVLKANDFKGTIFTPEMTPALAKVRVGDIFSDEKSAKKFADKVFEKTKIEFLVEPYNVVIGKEKIFLVVLTTKDPFKVQDYKQKLIQKGYSPEVTELATKDN